MDGTLRDPVVWCSGIRQFTVHLVQGHYRGPLDTVSAALSGGCTYVSSTGRASEGRNGETEREREGGVGERRSGRERERGGRERESEGERARTSSFEQVCRQLG